MRKYQFDHAHVYSGDPWATARFYVENFGATVKTLETQEMEAVDDGFTRVLVDLGGKEISIKGPSSKRSGEESPSGFEYGLNHLGIAVDDLDSAVADLKSKGVHFIQDVTNFLPGIRISFLRGPDNTVIELLERKPAT